MQRPGPGPQRQRHAPHAFQPQHGNGTAHGQHGTVARHRLATDLRAIDRTQQLERQRQVLEQHLGQFVGAVAFHQGQPGRPFGALGRRRQHAGDADLVQQQRQRPALAAALHLQPAFQRPGQRARVAVALALLAVGGAVDDDAQRLGDRPRRAEGKPHDLAPQRRQPLGHLGGVGFVERRLAGQHQVHEHADAQDVGLGCRALLGQRRCVGHLAGLALDAGDLQPHQQWHPLVGHQHAEGLQVPVRAAGVVRVGQRVQQGADQRGRLVGGHSLAPDAVGQRRAVTQVVGHVGPALVHADLQRRRQPRVVDTGGLAHALQPAVGLRLVGRHHAGQQQHQVLAVARVGHVPGHRARTAAQQPDQREARKLALPAGTRRRRGGRGRRWHTLPIGTPHTPGACGKQRGQGRLIRAPPRGPKPAWRSRMPSRPPAAPRAMCQNSPALPLSDGGRWRAIA